MDETLKRLLSRKFVLSILALITSYFLMWFAKISDGVYSTIVIATVGAFITGNVIQNNTVPK